MTCPACGARNADSAEWCSLCYTPLRTAAPAAEASAPVTEEAPAPAAGARPGADVGATPATSADGRFRRTADGLDWRCVSCETWNPIERQTCTSCGAPFTRTVAPEEPDAAPELSETAAVAASLVLPGAGHVLLGRSGAGALRILLYVIWLLGGVVLLRAAAAEGQSIVPAVPLLLGALVVLVASVVEAQQVAVGHDTVLLTPRVTLWLVVGVIGGLLVSFFAATASLGG